MDSRTHPCFEKLLSASTERVITEFKAPFDHAVAANKLEPANLLAMRAAEILFQADPETARSLVWQEFFSRLTNNYACQYQSLDFEVVDYEMYRLLQDRRLLRGPRPDVAVLAAGNYVTFLGAAQLFGRFQSRAPHAVVAEHTGVPCLNLSIGGAGPESFARKDTIKIANGGKAVVVQVLSGRSIGCDEYPGARLTSRRDGKPGKVDRLKLLREIWTDSPQEAVRLVRKWQTRYVTIMRELLLQLARPVVLVWISERAPEDWSLSQMDEAADFGRFPQLVDRAMLDEIAGHCAKLVLLDKDEGLPHGFASRLTGQNCPVYRPDGTLIWENTYYPSSSASAEISTKIAGAVASLLN